MNRRRFIQSLVAVFSLPATPAWALRPAVSAVPTVAAVPAQARSWAVYMSTLHGECTPQALQTMLNIPALDAKKYITQLITDGVIRPNPFLQNSATKLVKSNENSLLEKIKNRLEMKAQVGSDEARISEEFDEEGGEESDEMECLEADGEWLEEDAEFGPNNGKETGKEPSKPT